MNIRKRSITCGQGLRVGGEGQFFYSHLQWRGILKPSSAPFLGVIQDMYLDSTYKGRGCSQKSVSMIVHRNSVTPTLPAAS